MVTASTPAGVISELRMSSPSGQKGADEPQTYSRGRDIGGNNSLGRVGLSQMTGDYHVPEYGNPI